MNTKEIGYRDGAQAYRDGKPRIIKGEASLDYWIETHTGAECLDYMKGWYNGWDMENLNTCAFCDATDSHNFGVCISCGEQQEVGLKS